MRPFLVIEHRAETMHVENSEVGNECIEEQVDIVHEISDRDRRDARTFRRAGLDRQRPFPCGGHEL